MNKINIKQDFPKELVIALQEECDKVQIDAEATTQPSMIEPVARNLKEKGIEFTPKQFAKYWAYATKACNQPDYTWKQFKKDAMMGFLFGYPMFTLVACAPTFLIGWIVKQFGLPIAFWIKLIVAAGLALVPFILGVFSRCKKERQIAKTVQAALAVNT